MQKKTDMENENTEQESTKNDIARSLQTIGWFTIIVGIALSVVLLVSGMWQVAVSLFVGAFISGIMFLGFGEIISLLQKLVDNSENS